MGQKMGDLFPDIFFFNLTMLKEWLRQTQYCCTITTAGRRTLRAFTQALARALLGPGLAENVGHPGTDVQLVGLPIGFPGQKCAFSFKVNNHGPTYIKLLKLGQN
jgi:hypothetical protein